MKALVVDRSDAMRSVLNRILSMRGFDVEEAADSVQARDNLRQMGVADVVLVDTNPAAMDDLELIAYLRQRSSPGTLLIMMVAAEPGSREIQNALAAGASDYIIKPFNSMQIDSRLAAAGLAS